MKISSGTTAAGHAALIALLLRVVLSTAVLDLVPRIAASHVVSGSASRLPMSVSEVITDLEAEGAAHVTTCAFLTSRSVTKSTRSRLFRSLFGITGDGDHDDEVEDGSTTAFGKRMGEEHEESEEEDGDGGVGIVVASPRSKAGASVAEVSATVQACGGTVVYVASARDLDRGEGLFDSLAPALERLLASRADGGEGELGSAAQTDRSCVLIVAVDADADASTAMAQKGMDIASARSKFEAAAAAMLTSIVQPDGTKRAAALGDVFDRVEYVPSTGPVQDLLCEAGGSTDPTTAASAVSSAVYDLEKGGTAASCGLAKPVDLAAARRLGPASHDALKLAMSAVVDATMAADGSSSSPRLVPDFGDLCDAAVKRAMERFNSDAGPTLLKQSSVARRIRHDLLEEIYAELADVYEVQVQELRVSSFDAFKRGLSQLRLTANLGNDMDRVMSESVRDFISRARKLRAHGRGVSLSWPAADAIASDFRSELKEFTARRLQMARLDGKYRPAPRKGVTLGFHWLLPKPFGNDYRQEPWKVHARDNLVYTPSDKITDVGKSDIQTGDWRRSVVPNPSGSEMIYLQ